MWLFYPIHPVTGVPYWGIRLRPQKQTHFHTLFFSPIFQLQEFHRVWWLWGHYLSILGSAERNNLNITPLKHCFNFFIDVKLTKRKINHFKVNNSTAFSIFTILYNQPLLSSSKTLSSPQEETLYPLSSYYYNQH